jgi:uncharacterized protein
MRPNPRHDPRRLDIADAAAQAVELQGRWPLAGLPRLAVDHPGDAPALTGDAAWSARACTRPGTGGAPEIWLHVSAQAEVQRSCQRCLQPLTLGLSVDRKLRFVPGEDAAAALDADSDDDVLALEPQLDLLQLVEDELLLALPLVPRHEVCPEPLPHSAGAESAEPAAHPFASLAVLKPGSGRH